MRTDTWRGYLPLGTPARFERTPRMKFRTQFAAVAAVAALVGLAACGGGDDDEATSAGSTTTDTSGAASTPKATPHPAGHSDSSAVITMGDDNTFSPAALTVAPGTTIEIKNPGSVRHNLKDDATKGKTFDSGDINGGENGTITAPDKAGSYPYACTYHFGMKGTVTVK